MPALGPILQARIPDLAVAAGAGVVAGTLGVGLPAAAGVAAAVGVFSELSRLHTKVDPDPPPPLSDLPPLTRLEAEVARLAANGLSNREIAARIHRGERAVEDRLQSCYNRLGIHNRAELTRWVTERDLARPDPPNLKSVP